MCWRATRSRDGASEGSRSHGMGAREKYSARPSSAVTTFTTCGVARTSSVAGAAAVTNGNRPDVTTAAAPRTAASDTNGSSPCTLTMASKPAKRRDAATSATRSVPDGWLGSVSATAASVRRSASAISSLSVATTTWSATRMAETRSHTRTTKGTPPMRRSGFRGRREAPRRAGMTASVFTQGSETHAGQQFARHSSYTPRPRKQTDWRGFLLGAATPGCSSSRLPGERHADLETRVSTGGIHQIFDAGEAERHERADVLNEARQPLNAGRTDPVADPDCRRADEGQPDPGDRDLVARVEVQQLVASHGERLIDQRQCSAAPQVGKALWRRRVPHGHHRVQVGTEALQSERREPDTPVERRLREPRVAGALPGHLHPEGAAHATVLELIPCYRADGDRRDSTARDARIRPPRVLGVAPTADAPGPAADRVRRTDGPRALGSQGREPFEIEGGLGVFVEPADLQLSPVGAVVVPSVPAGGERCERVDEGRVDPVVVRERSS